MLLILLLLSFGVYGQDFDSFLFKERWLETENDIEHSLRHKISPGCLNDTYTWINSLIQFTKDFNQCVLHNETKCTDAQIKEIKTDAYGFKQLDAFGRIPAGVLDVKYVAYGDLYECEEVSKHFYYPTHYCFLHSRFSLNNTCENSPRLPIKKAVCMPKSCSESDILNIYTWLSKKFHSPLGHCSVTCKRDEGITDTFTWIFLAFMSTLTALCLVSTILDFIMESFNKNMKSPILKILLSFSIYTNGSTVWSTSPPKEGHLKCLDCIRFLSMVWVASGHVFSYIMNNDSIVPLINITKPILIDTLMSAFFSVDTFFVISGLLVSYMFFKAVAKSPQMVKNPLTWVLFYVHRYLRLTPPYMLFICFIIVVGPLMTGVILNEWNMMVGIIEPCKNGWWRNLLYINNFNNGPTCYGIAWYMACDMQLYVVAPLFLLAFYFSQWIGLAAVILASIGSSIATIVITVHYNLPATAARPDHAQQFNEYIYEKPWIRCPPYLIGMVAGYYLAHYGNKKLKVHWILPLLGWLFNIAMALAILYGPHDYLALETNWAKGVRGIYDAASRIGWAFFIVWVIGANHYGYGGPIASLMEHPIWQPFGRLSYTAYLCHMFLIWYMWNLQDRPLHFTGVWSQFIQVTLPVIVMTYTFAFFWSCLCEIPFLKLEKMLFDAILPKKKDNKSGEETKAKEEVEKTEQWS